MFPNMIIESNITFFAISGNKERDNSTRKQLTTTGINILLDKMETEIFELTLCMFDHIEVFASREGNRQRMRTF